MSETLYLDQLPVQESILGSDSLVSVRGTGLSAEQLITVATLSSAIVDVLPSGVSFDLPSSVQGVYVAKSGNDTTGDGTIYRPYLTVQKALTSISDATTTKPYAVFVGPGIYDENAIALRGNVYLVGCGQYEGLGCRIGVANNLITTDSTNGGGSRTGVYNVNFKGTTGLSADGISNGGSTGWMVILDNVNFNGNVSFKARQNGDAFSWRKGACFGNVSVSGCSNLNIDSVTLVGGSNALADSPRAPLKGTIRASQVNGLTVTSSASTSPDPNNNFIQTFYSNIATCTLTQGTGTSIWYGTDAVSYPFNGFTKNSGVLYYWTDSIAIGYNPTTAGDWPIQPINVFEALDKLAARVKALEP